MNDHIASISDADRRRVAVVGATGYVGARLAPRLVAAGHDVVCLARSADDIRAWSWGDQVEAVEADLSEPQHEPVFDGCHVVVHLVHSMSDDPAFEERDRRIAENVASLAERSRVGRIVFLGGLGAENGVSDHLGSRHEVGQIFADSAVPTTELRAALVLGSGSASFEMLRHLGETSPILPVPREVTTTLCQPISIDDALDDLVWAIETDEAHGVVDIGGADRMTYAGIIETYGEVAGLRRRRFLPVPFVPTRLSGAVLNLLAPLPGPLVRSLAASVEHDVVVDPERDISRLRPERRPLDIAGSIRAALRADADPTSHWTDDLAIERPAGLIPADEPWAGATVNHDTRVATTELTPGEAFARISSIGGRRGWLVAQPLWELRGLIDRLVPGGVGIRRGRRHPTSLRRFDVIDWWRVDAIDPPRRLLLEAEMKMPGQGWLEWIVEPLDEGGAEVTQRAIFVPRGLAGRLYWLTLLPFHGFLFPRLLERILEGELEAIEQEETDAEHGSVSEIAGEPAETPGV